MTLSTVLKSLLNQSSQSYNFTFYSSLFFFELNLTALNNAWLFTFSFYLSFYRSLKNLVFQACYYNYYSNGTPAYFLKIVNVYMLEEESFRGSFIKMQHLYLFYLTHF